MRSLAWLTALTLVVAACTAEHQVFELEVPDEVELLAVLALGEEGQVTGGSVLRPHAPGAPLGLAVPADAPALLIGYSAEQLRAFPISELVIDAPANRLRAAQGCEGRLPEPSWAARWLESGAVAAERPPPLSLTTDSAQLVCPDPARLAISIDARCRAERCAVQTTGRDRCTLELDLEDCRLGTARMSFDADGEACLELSESAEACDVLAGEGQARAHLQCAEPVSCEFDLYAVDRGIDEGLNVQSVAPFEAEKYLHSILARNVFPLPRALVLLSGYTLDMLPLPDRLLAVSVSDGFPVQECVRLRPGLLSAYDLETLAPIETTTVPPCVFRLLADPAGTGFAAPFYERDTWHIGRFDARGRRVLSAPAGGTGPEASLRYFGLDFDVTEIGRTETGDALVLLFSRKLENTPEIPRAALGVYDAASLRLLHLHELSDGHEPRSMAMQGTEAILPSALTRRVRWVDVFTGEIVRDVPIEQSSVALSSFSGVMAGAATEDAFVALTGAERGVAHLPPAGALRRLTMFERDFDAISFGPWPWDPELVLASGTVQNEEGDWDSVLALFAPAERRFRPGSVSLGPGIVSRIRTDTSGRLYFLLPWKPEIVRWSHP